MVRDRRGLQAELWSCWRVRDRKGLTQGGALNSEESESWLLHEHFLALVKA